MNTCTRCEPQGADTEAAATAQWSLNTQNTVGYTSDIACTAHTSHVNEEYP